MKSVFVLQDGLDIFVFKSFKGALSYYNDMKNEYIQNQRWRVLSEKVCMQGEWAFCKVVNVNGDAKMITINEKPISPF